jgi:hypothetical protein
MKQKLLAEIQGSIESGLLPSSVSPSAAFRLLTAGLVGVAVLRMSDRFGAGENADDFARDMIDLTLAGLASGHPLRSHADICALEETPPSDTTAPLSSSRGVVP